METWTKHYHEQWGQPGWDVCKSSEDGSEIHVVAYCYTEADADAIIRDHKLAALAEEMRAAIEPLGDDAAFRPADGKWWVQWAARYDAIATGSAEGQS